MINGVCRNVCPADIEEAANEIKRAMAIADVLSFVDSRDALCDETISKISGLIYQCLLDALKVLNCS